MQEKIPTDFKSWYGCEFVAFSFSRGCIDQTNSQICVQFRLCCKAFSTSMARCSPNAKAHVHAGLTAFKACVELCPCWIKKSSTNDDDGLCTSWARMPGRLHWLFCEFCSKPPKTKRVLETSPTSTCDDIRQQEFLQLPEAFSVECLHCEWCQNVHNCEVDTKLNSADDRCQTKAVLTIRKWFLSSLLHWSFQSPSIVFATMLALLLGPPEDNGILIRYHSESLECDVPVPWHAHWERESGAHPGTASLVMASGICWFEVEAALDGVVNRGLWMAQPEQSGLGKIPLLFEMATSLTQYSKPTLHICAIRSAYRPAQFKTWAHSNWRPSTVSISTPVSLSVILTTSAFVNISTPLSWAAPTSALYHHQRKRQIGMNYLRWRLEGTRNDFMR